MAKSKIDPRQCRCLTVDGHQCKNQALPGENFCKFHKQHRRPVCPQKDAVEMPLLEDVSAIQLVASQVAHGLFTGTLDPRSAGKILYACQVAAMTVRRPAPVKTEPAEDDEPVTEVFQDGNGEVLGPDLPWFGGRFAPVWSRDKMLYEQECERLGKLAPQSAAEMPPEGWLTPEEQAQPDIMWPNRWMMKTLERRIEADKQLKLPHLEERACYYDNPHCHGPIKKSPAHVVCEYCAWEREAHERIFSREKDPMPPSAREACAREGIRLEIFGNDSANDTPGAPVKPEVGLSGTTGESSPGAPALPVLETRDSAQAPETGDFVFMDDPEETEVLDPQKVILLDLHKCADEMGTLPPLEERTCFYSMPECAGPASPNPCTYCRRERDHYRKLHKGGGDTLDLRASADGPPIRPNAVILSGGRSGCPFKPESPSRLRELDGSQEKARTGHFQTSRSKAPAEPGLSKPHCAVAANVV